MMKTGTILWMTCSLITRRSVKIFSECVIENWNCIFCVCIVDWLELLVLYLFYVYCPWTFCKQQGYWHWQNCHVNYAFPCTLCFLFIIVNQVCLLRLSSSICKYFNIKHDKIVAYIYFILRNQFLDNCFDDIDDFHPWTLTGQLHTRE